MGIAQVALDLESRTHYLVGVCERLGNAFAERRQKQIVNGGEAIFGSVGVRIAQALLGATQHGWALQPDTLETVVHCKLNGTVQGTKESRHEATVEARQTLTVVNAVDA